MKEFVCRLLLFLIPFYFIGALIVTVCCLGYITGEFRDFEQLIEEQRQDHNVFIGMGYNEQTAYYKLANANYYQADVIALGTSRVMQFGDGCFDSSFYNCGGAVRWNYDEYLNFIKNLNYTPEVIILGLDQWVFNDIWNRSCPVYEEEVPIEWSHRNRASMGKDMVKDFFYHKWDFQSIRNYPMNYGFNGRVKDQGFRWNGAYYNGDIYRNPKAQNDYLFSATLEAVERGEYRFEWGEHIDEETCEYLSAFLQYCNENEIIVVGFTPPFAPSVYEKMSMSGNYGYFAEINPRCERIFKEYGYMYFDYTDISMLHVDDTYFIDGFHGGEVAYAYLLRDMTRNSGDLKKIVDEKKLSNLINNRYNNLMLQDFIHKR